MLSFYPNLSTPNSPVPSVVLAEDTVNILLPLNLTKQNTVTLPLADISYTGADTFSIIPLNKVSGLNISN